MTQSKLGLYITDQGIDNLDAWLPVLRGKVVVTMNLDAGFLQRLRDAGAFVIGRVYFEDQRINGEYWMNFMEPHIRGKQNLLDTVMAINEPAVWSGQEAMQLCDETRAWSGFMHAQGFKTAAYSFSEGHPDPSLLPFLINHGCDYYIRHEYDAPEMWRTQPWRCLRYRSEHAYFPQPFIIGETGIDGGVSGIDKPERGWREFGDIDHYLTSMKWYNAELQKDSYVIGAALFAAQWNIGNGSFDVQHEDKIRAYLGAEQSMPNLTDLELARFFIDAGFTLQLDIGIAVALAESGGNPQATFTNTDGSIDRGIMQINNHSHSEVTDACAFDPACAIKEAARIAHNGAVWDEWVTFTTKRYKTFLPRAVLALNALPPNVVEQAILSEVHSHAPLFNFDPTLAFMKAAHNIRSPMTDEYRQTIEGVVYAVQRFTDGIRYCREGDWANVRWFRNP